MAMSRLFLFVFFVGIASWQDARHKRVELWLFWVFGAAAAVLLAGQWFCGAGEDLFSHLLGGIPGIMLLGVSKITKEGIGVGDGLFFFVSGLMLGLEKNLMLLCGGVLLCGGYGLWLLFYKRVRYGIDARKETLPFLPFAAAAGIALVAAGR